MRNVEQEIKRLNELPKMTEANIIWLVSDSCPASCAQSARTPNLDKIGTMQVAWTLAPYTPAAHAAMWAGHLPSTRGGVELPFYHEPTRQPFRIVTAPSRDANKGCGALLTGTSVIDGFRNMGFHVQGVGGVSQFSSGSWLRTGFPWSDFRYFGPDLNEELMKPRGIKTFPLEHSDEIVSTLPVKDPWMLFVNSNETHYPWDSGAGINEDLQKNVLPSLGKVLNLRSTRTDTETLRAKEIVKPFAGQLRQMQVEALEAFDTRVGNLLEMIKSRENNRPTIVIAHGDHGDSFGEDFAGQEVWGHLHQSIECMTVPLWIGELK